MYYESSAVQYLATSTGQSCRLAMKRLSCAGQEVHLWERSYRQADRGAQPDEHSSYAAIESLEHHWDKLSNERKEEFAQMAVVTKCVLLYA